MKNKIMNEKFFELLIADHPGRTVLEPWYNVGGGIIHFTARDAPSRVSWQSMANATNRPGFEIIHDMDTDEIIGCNIWLPTEVYKAINARLQEPYTKKKKWWITRRLHVLWIHIKWFFKDTQ